MSKKMMSIVYVGLFASLCFLNAVVAAFATPARINNGKLEFAIANVGSKPVFTQEDKDETIKQNPDAVVVDLSPTEEEIKSAETSTFATNDEYLKSLTKEGIIEKLMTLYVRIQVLKDIQDTVELPDLQKKYDDLVTEAKNFP